jgi:hypothetical protein
MRLRVLLLTFALLLPALPAAADTNQPWEFEGGGWGHGVGLSQFGTLGQVEDGRSVNEILAFYYKGTSVGQVDASDWVNNPEGLRIGLLPNAKAATLAAEGGAVTFCQPDPDCAHLKQVINPGDLWVFETKIDEPAKCRLRQLIGGSGNGKWNVCSASIADLSPTNRVSVNSGNKYARGALRFAPSADGFHVVAALDLERYLYGLAEVPSGWPAKALQVQAIAGRSYAVATARERADSNGKINANYSKLCGCHLVSTTLDQAYVGWSKEDPTNQGNRWVDAVNASNGDVVILNGTTVKTFYSSSNGGASENNEDVWPAAPIPYLRSVDDPWSADSNVNPLATWSVKVTDQDMAKYFGWDRALDAFIVQGPPGVLVRFTGWDKGGPVSTTLNGTQIATLVKSIGFGYFAPGSTSTAIRVSPYFSKVTDPPGFDDIVGHLFEDDIEWLLLVDVTKGCNPPDNTNFCPDDNVTRGQMAAFIKRYLDLPPASQDYFTDDNGSTFESDINRLAEAGITKGCNPPANDRFCPNDRVSREQMAAFIVRALDLTANTHSGFNDVASSNTFFSDIGKLATAGITRGCNPPANTNYCPKDNVTRGQMAAFLHRSDKLGS